MPDEPKVGAVETGRGGTQYRYKGGDRYNKANWEPVTPPPTEDEYGPSMPVTGFENLGRREMGPLDYAALTAFGAPALIAAPGVLGAVGTGALLGGLTGAAETGTLSGAATGAGIGGAFGALPLVGRGAKALGARFPGATRTLSEAGGFLAGMPLRHPWLGWIALGKPLGKWLTSGAAKEEATNVGQWLGREAGEATTSTSQVLPKVGSEIKTVAAGPSTTTGASVRMRIGKPPMVETELEQGAGISGMRPNMEALEREYRALSQRLVHTPEEETRFKYLDALFKGRASTAGRASAARVPGEGPRSAWARERLRYRGPRE